MVETIVSVVIEVAKCLAPSTERQFRYVRDYKSNIENLKTQVEKLEGGIVSMQHAVDEAKRNGEEIEQSVQNWLAGANNANVEAKKFGGDEASANNRCYMGLCPNLKTRHRLSKEAVRQVDVIVKLQEAGRFERISYSIIPEDTFLMSNKDYEAFESRMSTLNKILGALKNPDVNILGIFGMGGIGKTTLAKEVARKAENDKVFDQIIFTEVSQSPDIRKIQGEIADKLGLKFDEESELGRARSLWSRLKKEKRILVILDNIWDYLDLRAVGIPHRDDHKGCKVLLTARSLDVLSTKMDSQQNFLIGALEGEEAWSLFKKMAGDYIEGSEFQSVAREVAKECAGLPVSIVTVARALRNKRLFEWKDALVQLRRPSSTNFKDIQPTAYKAIELSYNKLEGEELRNIFLLIGYAYVESIDNLIRCGVGLGLFQGISKMEEARDRVSTLVNKLKASCMLLDKGLSMHDVVRDVAISIGSAEKNVFTATGELFDGFREWSDETAAKLYTSIVLLDVKTNVFPQVPECPQLKLFSMRAARKYSSTAIPDNFFTRMMQVRVVVLTNMRLTSPMCSSLGLLINLRTLCLYDCELLIDLSVIGDLKKLEILCLNDSEITELPVELGELTQLRLLDLRKCWQLEVIPPNVLSKLSQLEGLYIGDMSFYQWEVEGKGVKNASLEELKHLPNLTSLELQIKDVNALPRGFFFRKLERFKINLGYWSWEPSNNCCREFRLQLNNKIRLKDGLMVQLQGIEDLDLRELDEQDVDYFVSELVNVGSSQLKHLRLDGCDDASNPDESKRQEKSTNDIPSNEIVLEEDINNFSSLFIEKVSLPKLETLYLDSINIERIWQNQVAAMSCGIQNLTRLILYNCRNLRYLFSSSIVSRFVRLQHLQICKCPVLEEIIVVDDQEEISRINNIVMFPRLKSLKMQSLEKLTSFCAEDLHIIGFPSLKELVIIGCPDQFMAKFKSTTNGLKKKVFPNLEELRVDAKHIATNKCPFSEDLLCKLKCLDVEVDEPTAILSLDDFLHRFHTMEGLYIGGGPYYLRESKEEVENGMEVIIRGVNRCCDLKHILKQQTNSSIIDNLEILELWGCDHLINLVPSSTPFQNLITLKVSYCEGLVNVLTSSTAKSLVQLIEMSISGCDKITEIVADDGDAAKDEAIVFSELMDLELNNLESLTSFCSGSRAFRFPSLERLAVDGCPNLKIFTGGELSTPKLRSVELEWWAEKRLAGPDDLNTAIKQLYLENMGDNSTEVEDEEEDAQSSDNW